jgi:hypothetical protein
MLDPRCTRCLAMPLMPQGQTAPGDLANFADEGMELSSMRTRFKQIMTAGME